MSLRFHHPRRKAASVGDLPEVLILLCKTRYAPDSLDWEDTIITSLPTGKKRKGIDKLIRVGEQGDLGLRECCLPVSYEELNVR
jgi:hypothetical protein